MINLPPSLVHTSHRNNPIIIGRELVLITPGIDNIHELITDLPSTSKVVILDADTDSIEQITALLGSHTDLSSLHIVSHGASGCLYLGNTKLNFATLDQYSDRIQSWARVLQGKDIFLYGCHVAQGAMGHLFLQQLHQLTGANIAASRERVGKGNWNLDTRIGKTSSSIIFSPELQENYQSSFEPVVDFSVSTNTLIESEQTPFSFNFSLSEPPPAGGTVIRIEGSIPQAINQWNVVLTNPLGTEFPVDVSPGQDFSAFNVTITEQNASISLPIFNDGQDDSPQEITWTVTAVSGGSINPSTSTATVTIYDDPSEVPPSNTAPVADNDSYNTAFNTAITIDAANGVLNGDTDGNGNSLTAIIATQPQNGTVNLNSDGSFTYTPNNGFSGTDTFTYNANDGQENSNTATVSITVGAAPTPEISLSASVTNIVEDEGTETTLTFTLSEPPPGNGVVVTIDTGKPFALGDFDIFPPPPQASATGGQLVAGNADNSGFTFQITAQTATITLPVFDDQDRTANGAETDPDGPLRNDDQGEEQTTFSLIAGDGYTINSGSSSVTLTLKDTNNIPPVADNDNYGTAFETPLTVNADSGVLVGDTDSNGDNLTAVIITQPGNGSVALNADGSFTYTPNAGFIGADSFTYAANDGKANSNTATVSIAVASSANNPPVADNENYSTPFETALTVNAADGVLSGDTDGDGDNLTAVIITQPGNGSVSFNADGSFTYTPNAGFSGTDSFTYAANDGEDNSNTANVEITVIPPNTPPVADDDNYSTGFETQLTISAENGVLNGDTDEEQDALIAQLVVAPSNGNLTLNADGSFVYTPNPGFNGSDSFTYTANDGSADSNIATANIAVAAELPVASLSATPTTLVEEENTILVLTVNLSQVPPDGGINITIDSETAQSLGEFDLNSATFDSASLVSVNDDSSGLTINVTGQTATVNLPVLDDAINEGTENIIYALQPGSGYQINPAATSVGITIEDNDITVEDNPVKVMFEASSSGEISSFFYDLTAAGDGNVTVALTDDVLALGTEAEFDNLVGFYEVADTNGGIDTNGDGIADILPGDAGYAQAALSRSIDGLTIRAGSDGDGSRNTTASELSNTIVIGGKLYAPFAIANGGALTPQEYLQINPDNAAAQSPEQQVAYFAFVGANPDGAVHLRSFGDNVFGFEDLPANLGGSDNDFNDAVFRFNFS